MRNLETPKRAGEAWRPATRSSRFFQQDNRWYVKMRGNCAKGPFASINAARAGLRTLTSPKKTRYWLS